MPIRKMYNQTWVEINKKALEHNVRVLKARLPKKCKSMCVVKANAYGHGQKEIISILKNNPYIDMFATFSFEDAVQIRKITNKPIVVLCTLDTIMISDAIQYDITVTISRIDQLLFLKKKRISKKLKVHIKVDTGLGRQGFLKKDIHKVCALIHGLKNISIEGLYTHLSGAEGRRLDTYTISQYELLLEWKSAFHDIGIYPLTHISATSGVIRIPILAQDIVRFGLGVYGLWPSDETVLADKGKTKLQPVLSWKTKIVEVKKLPIGACIAYDCTCTLSKDTTIAILPVGYWDGIPRSASGNAWVLIKGKKCKILGRVMMNMCVVDVSDVVQPSVGDSVVVIGVDRKITVSAEMLAHASGTINYEIVTRINPLIPRIIY